VNKDKVVNRNFKMSEITLFHGKDEKTSVSVHACGATVTSWKINGQEKIFVSTLAKRDGSKAIRGGIPLCFPQFGPWDSGRPQHGFARNSNDWVLKEKKVDTNGDATIVMVLTDNENTRKLWDFKFTFLYTIKLTLTELTLNASVENRSDNDFDLTFCFHTYLKVPQISGATVQGLNGLTYVDKTEGGQLTIEENDVIKIEGFVDRVYQDAPDVVVVQLDDKEKITLTKNNLCDYVVWNPWQQNCLKMADMDDDGYLSMICVEAAHASKRSIVKAGSTWNASHVLSSSQ